MESNFGGMDLSALLIGGTIVGGQLLHSTQNPSASLNHAWLQDWSPTNAVLSVVENVDGSF